MTPDRRAPLDPLSCYPLSTHERRDIWAAIHQWRLAQSAQAQRDAAAEVECRIAFMINDVIDKTIENRISAARGLRSGAN